MFLILTQCFPSRTGGIESLISNMALSLSECKKIIVFADSHNVLLDAIYDNNNKKDILIKRTSGIKFFRRRRKIKEIIPFIESNKVELIIADSWKSLELPIDYFNKKNVPTLCLAHGNEILFNDDKKKQRIIKTLKKANYIVANSQFTQKMITDILPNAKNISYVYPGAQDLRNIEANPFIRFNGKPILITIARLEERKGHVQILKTLKKLKLKFPQIQYIISGEGPEKSNLKTTVKDLKLEDNVIFTGLVNDPQKKYLYEKADLMIMPTLDQSNKRSIEGFGIAYLEAAFFGVPSIASKIGGTPEAVLHNKTGIIIDDLKDLYQSIDNLLANNDLIEKLGKQAQQRAIKDFNWKKVTQNYLSLINN